MHCHESNVPFHFFLLANIYEEVVRRDAIDFYGNDIAPFPIRAVSYARCILVCGSTPGCNAFTYSEAGQACYPKFNMGQYQAEKSDVSSGYYLLDYASCCSKCQGTSNCAAFVYSPSTKTCQLKRTASGGVQKNDSITGYYDPTTIAFPGVFERAPRMLSGVTFSIQSNVSQWHSVGYYAVADVVVEIKVLAKVGASGWSVQIGCHSDDLSGLGTQRRPPLLYLTKSLNSSDTVQISLHYGGLLFLRSPDASGCSITVSLNNVVLTPTYNLIDSNRATNWQYQQRNAEGLWADIAGRYIVYNIPSNTLLKMKSAELDSVLQLWDSAVLAHHDLRGTKPIRRERVVSDEQPLLGYMHAGYPIVTMMDVANPNSELFIFYKQYQNKSNPCGGSTYWGIFHEIGHNMQRSWWTFDGTIEVTTNIFTVHAMDTVCKVRLGIYDWRNDQISLTRTYILQGAIFDEWKKNPAIGLLIYIQLAREFGWDSYKSVFRYYENIKPNLSTDQQKMDYWIETFSRQVQKNLVPLFNFWGFPISKSTKNATASLPTAKISDQLIQIAPQRYTI
ncbi:unnamed protein product [Rotaria socialis]|uniref:Peptidase M60 domain-containing protein n=1 Tax=Rotaria socialis TaxID=392032 RepID=A0A817Q6U8_9BILA|nr:unnamed protein product [Rotaria socialis]